MTETNLSYSKKKAFQLIVLFGLVSLFGDIVYEGARSVNGPYLKTLGANAAIVGFIAGIGEFIGYALRILSGYFSDKTKSYWLFVFLGYGLLVSVPLLSLTGVWQVAALFMVLERLGKALRSPSRDTIVSQATKQIGTGMGFGISEAMDQIGAITGPLLFTVLFYLGGMANKGISDYQRGYGLFWLPFILLILCIFFAYIKFPHPEKFEDAYSAKDDSERLPKVFWLYTVFSFLTTFGFINFIILGYHFKAKNILSDAQIPLFYAVAMGVDAIAALAIGKFYDILKEKRKNEAAGLNSLVIIPVLSIVLIFFALSGNFTMVIIGIVIWGIVMGAHETIMKSAIADITPIKKRGTGYGILNTGYGLAMFFGSALIGFLYSISIFLVVWAVVVAEALALILYFVMQKEALKKTFLRESL